jgi:protein-tyrosine phosphatase
MRCRVLKKLPVADSYRVGDSQFFAGEYPGAANAEEAERKIRELVAAGIDFLVDLTEEHELEPYSDHLPEAIEYIRCPVQDLSLPTQQEMVAILDVIDDALAGNKSVYVHCWGGVGRTGTVVGCHLVRHGTTGEDALARIAEWRRDTPDGHRTSPETEEQRQMILNWRTGE